MKRGKNQEPRLIGRILNEKYRVLCEIGRGGMGVVYEAEDVDTLRPLAVKTLRPNSDEGLELSKRFEREAYVQSMLKHPNIVEVESMGVLEEGTLYLVMEKVSGKSLDRLIQDGVIGPRKVLVMARQVLLALHFAHQHGVIHRDLKPENIMLVRVGEPGKQFDRVKLIDFGLVKMADSIAPGLGMTKLTRTGIVYGTPAYMAPEQAQGRPLDGRTDLYALGVTMFEALTGRCPFIGDGPVDVVRKHIKKPPPRLVDIAPNAAYCTAQMEYLISKALAKKPEARFADARAMTEALDEAFQSIGHLPAED